MGGSGLAEGAGRLGGIVHGSMIHFENHIIGPESGYIGRAAWLDVFNQGARCPRSEARVLREIGG